MTTTTADRTRQIRALREQRLTHAQIASQLGIHVTTVRAHLAVDGDPWSREGRRARFDQMAADHPDMSIEELTRLSGIPDGAAVKRLGPVDTARRRGLAAQRAKEQESLLHILELGKEGPVGQVAYDQSRDLDGTYSSGVLVNRRQAGTWFALVEGLGCEPPKRRGGGGRKPRWTVQQMEALVTEYFSDLDHSGAYWDFGLWLTTRDDDAPTVQSVCAKLGRWSTIRDSHPLYREAERLQAQAGLSDEQLADRHARARAGVRVADLAADTVLTSRQMNRLLDLRNDLAPPPPPSPEPSQDELERAAEAAAKAARMTELRSSGLTWTQVADEMGYAQGTVATRLFEKWATDEQKARSRQPDEQPAS